MALFSLSSLNKSLLNQFHQVADFGSHLYAADLGSATTRMIADQKALLLEPTCIALHRRSRAVVAIGENAQEMLGKTPPAIEVIHPIRQAKVTDAAAARQFLESVLKEKCAFQQSLFITTGQKKLRVAVSPSLSAVQKDFLRRMAKDIGFTHVDLVDKNQALLRRWRRQKFHSAIICMIDWGAMTTELSIAAQNEIVVHKTLQIGGEDVTAAIIRVLRSNYQCEVGWQTAEKMKMVVGRLMPDQQSPKLFMVRGLDAVTSLPKTVQVAAADFDEALAQIGEEMYSGLREFFQDAPAELVTAALDEGIVMTGGGSLLAGVREFLMKRVQCPIHHSNTPFEDCIRGLHETNIS